MKNVCAIILALSCIFFASCSQKEYHTAYIIESAFAKGGFEIYSSDYGEKSSFYFSDELFLLMLGKNGKADEKKLVFSVTAALSLRENACEIILFSLYDKSQSPDIIKLCERRIERLKKAFIGTQYEQIIDSAEIFCKGKYVLLLITDDNSKYKSQIFDKI